MQTRSIIQHVKRAFALTYLMLLLPWLAPRAA
jgi:hypothetical protein